MSYFIKKSETNKTTSNKSWDSPTLTSLESRFCQTLQKEFIGIIIILVRHDLSKTRLLVGTTRENLSLQMALWVR
jgi:hypothetical protein